MAKRNPSQEHPARKRLREAIEEYMRDDPDGRFLGVQIIYAAASAAYGVGKDLDNWQLQSEISEELDSAAHYLNEQIEERLEEEEYEDEEDEDEDY